MTDKTTITLVQPITRKGADPITTVTLTEPSTGALRGLKLSLLSQLDVNEVQKLLPRITEPALTPDEVAGLKAADFFSLAIATLGFFMTPDQVDQIKTDQGL